MINHETELNKKFLILIIYLAKYILASKNIYLKNISMEIGYTNNFGINNSVYSSILLINLFDIVFKNTLNLEV